MEDIANAFVVCKLSLSVCSGINGAVIQWIQPPWGHCPGVRGGNAWGISNAK